MYGLQVAPEAVWDQECERATEQEQEQEKEKDMEKEKEKEM